MSRGTWETLRPLLHHALEMPAEARVSWLAEMRETRPDVADELARLLAAEEQLDANGFLEGTNVIEALGAVPSLAGQRLGAYTLERPIGRGGMGTVWLGRRSDGRFEGRVAVKLLNMALLERAGHERFKREGYVLARLTHANIARLIDAGVTTTGQPFLVLDYVDGQRIDVHCEERQLSIPQRLALFRQVLAAVAHAHANLVIHRDLKPSNILVTSDGTVKLLDFGIAKLLEDEQAEAPRTELTDVGGRVLTPEYAAPEQVRGDPVTMATDVYALGVLLYVLVAGRHPTGQDAKTPAEHVTAILDAEPPRLDRGDLDNIVAKALRKNPAERYPTVSALDDDLQRFERHQPVSARPDSFGYRARRFVRRHRAGVVAVAGVAFTLVAATVVSITQMLEARRQRDAASIAAQRAAASSELQAYLLTLTGPGGEALSMAEQVERGREMLERQYQSDPSLLADMLIELAARHYELSDHTSERRMLSRAQELAASVSDRALLARVHCDKADSYANEGHVDSATAQLALAQAEQARLGAPLPTEARAICLMAAGIVHRFRGEPDSSIARMQEAVRLLEREQQGRTTTRYLGALNSLSTVLVGAGRSRDANDVQRRVMAALDSVGHGDGYAMVTVAFNAGKSLMDLGEYVEARRLVQRQIERSSRGSPDKIPTMLAHVYGQINDVLQQDDTARAMFDRVLRDTTITFPTIVAQANTGIATVLLRSRRLADAGPFLAAARDAWSAAPQRPITQAQGYWLQGLARRARGDTAGALSYLERQLAAMGYAKGTRGRHMYYSLHLAGECALGLGDLPRAEEYARAAQASASLDSLAKLRSGLAGESTLLLAKVHRARGDLAGASAALDRARPALANGFGADHPRTREAVALADTLARR